MKRGGADHDRMERLKDILHVHRGERRGTLLLAGLIALLFGWVIYEQWIRVPPQTDLGVLRAQVDAWIAARRDTTVELAALPEPFPFDPNLLERQEWLALGLSPRQVDGIERYRSKGGRFRTKRDLARMYTIPAAQYERLAPFIQLPDSLAPRKWPQRDRGAEGPRYAERSSERPAFERNTVTRALVEVNTADTTTLIALPGIGPAFARGIVKFRDRLGGYHHLDQLAEVYVLKDKPDAVERLKELLVVDTLMMIRIPINTCTVEELAAHPYSGWKIAKPLIAYRKQHGPFRKVADITGCAVVDEAVFRKLAPYLTVE